jgi:hypothetical protein
MALLEARLVIAKLLWHFDMELDGEHETWVDDARFYVSLTPLADRTSGALMFCRFYGSSSP